MTEAEKIEACARAAHEALRALAFARGDHVAAPWMALSAEDQLRVVLATERALSDKTFSSHEPLLFLCVVRSMAAALKMQVTYPETSASPERNGLPAMPAFPRRVIDFSKERPWDPHADLLPGENA